MIQSILFHFFLFTSCEFLCAVLCVELSSETINCESTDFEDERNQTECWLVKSEKIGEQRDREKIQKEVLACMCQRSGGASPDDVSQFSFSLNDHSGAPEIDFMISLNSVGNNCLMYSNPPLMTVMNGSRSIVQLKTNPLHWLYLHKQILFLSWFVPAISCLYF